MLMKYIFYTLICNVYIFFLVNSSLAALQNIKWIFLKNKKTLTINDGLLCIVNFPIKMWKFGYNIQIFYQQIVLHVSVHLNNCTNGITCPDKIIFNISAIIEISQKLSQEGTTAKQVKLFSFKSLILYVKDSRSEMGTDEIIFFTGNVSNRGLLCNRFSTT